ncbi:hypothetical protein AB0D67_10780 [Streptosporangium sp. NPDC048047]|uniref:hypothetical protein n=1 Tax=Streptosporangium sp. NPDC048047 TaxID=3155748 RepID=UPI00341E2C40
MLVSSPGRSPARWIVVLLGLGVVVAALAAAGGPYRQTRAFREVVACEERGGACFAREPVSIVGRRTYTTTTTHTNGDGTTSTDTTTHFEVTWQRAGGSRQSRDVSPGLYEKAKEGQPATLRLWRGEVVGVDASGETARFAPEASGTLGNWLILAFLGLGILLWGLLFGWWDGFFMLFWRAFVWTFMSIVPVQMATGVLAYGMDTGAALVVDIVVCALFVGIPAWMLLGSFDRW